MPETRRVSSRFRLCIRVEDLFSSSVLGGKSLWDDS